MTLESEWEDLTSIASATFVKASSITYDPRVSTRGSYQHRRCDPMSKQKSKHTNKQNDGRRKKTTTKNQTSKQPDSQPGEQTDKQTNKETAVFKWNLLLTNISRTETVYSFQLFAWISEISCLMFIYKNNNNNNNNRKITTTRKPPPPQQEENQHNHFQQNQQHQQLQDHRNCSTGIVTLLTVTTKTEREREGGGGWRYR